MGQANGQDTTTNINQQHNHKEHKMRLQKKITRKATSVEEAIEGALVATIEKSQEAAEQPAVKETYVIKKARATQIKAQAEASATTGKPEHSLTEHDPAIVATLTRATLMRDAQTRGIPYFRILSREALNEILNTSITTERQAELIEAAKTKWRAGWGTGTKKTTPTAPTVIQEIAEEQAAEPVKEPKLTKKQRKQALAEKYLSIGKAGK
jgi:hypothetical protein